MATFVAEGGDDSLTEEAQNNLDPMRRRINVMKNIGSRIVLALVVALTLAMGSVSTVSAARPTASVEISGVASGTFNISYSWSGYQVYAYSITIIDNGVTPNKVVYSYFRKFDGATSPFDSSGSVQATATIESDHIYTIYLTLLKKIGTRIDVVSSTWTPSQ